MLSMVKDWPGLNGTGRDARPTEIHFLTSCKPHHRGPKVFNMLCVYLLLTGYPLSYHLHGFRCDLRLACARMRVDWAGG